jgi:hypothetical protein
MTDSTHVPDSEPPPPAEPKRAPRWPLIAGIVSVGLIALGVPLSPARTPSGWVSRSLCKCPEIFARPPTKRTESP